ncbi:MAG: PBP1A family penicillin-binding protein [Candidatus Buchananbacteria bacterium]
MPNINWRDPQKLTPVHQRESRGGKISFSSGPAKTVRKRRRHLWKRMFKVLMPILAIGILFFALIAAAALFWISKDLPTADGVLKRNVTVSTKIYDRTGQTVLYDIHGNIKRTVIPLTDVPNYLKQAVITAEDRDFYQHHGFSPTGIIRSILVNITTGSKVSGSTLTQQFVKNAILTNEKTYTRKIKELLISYQIESKFTKDQILSMYLNEIPYGSVIYGVEAAAQSYFGKPTKDLTLAESAILAAIPNAPTYYSPYGNHKDKLLQRQRYILDSMVELNYISKEQAEAAKNEKLTFKPLKESIIAPHFVMYIKEILSEKYGENFINQEGLKVYTTLDLDKQKIAEEAVVKGVETNGAKYGFTNAALVSLDTKTGQILAMVGSADYFNEEIDGQVNVTLRPRQPGSSFKPIVYTASFIKGYTPSTIIYDTVTNFDTTGEKKYEPHNYHNDENGPVTLRQALAGSLNIPAVKLTYLTGMDNILNLAEKFGYTTFNDRSRFGLSIVLGGAEVKLLEHASAYATLATEGVKHEVNPILKIEDKNNKVIEEFKDKNEKVLDVEIARQTTDILSDDSARAYVFGAGSRLTLSGRPVATKTGTTNDFHDAWTLGYTPSLVCGVWVGNSDNAAMKAGADGSVIAAPIWNAYMTEALKGQAAEEFIDPQQVTTGKAVLDGIANSGLMVKIDTMSGKLATQYTPLSTTKEIATGEVHDILYYVDKDNPRGSIPAHPENDPQYYSWEAGVKTWAEKNNIITSGQPIPTAYDDIHLAGDQPQLNIISPGDKQTIKDSFITVDLQGSAARGVQKTEYLIDNQLIDTASGLTTKKILDLSELTNGYHTLTVIIKDDLQNTASKSIDFNLVAANPLPRLDWTSPIDGAVIENFPLSLKADLTNFDRIKQIDIYYSSTTSTKENFITTIRPQSDNFNFSWKKSPGSGNYIIYANIFNLNNKKYESAKLKIKI